MSKNDIAQTKKRTMPHLLIFTCLLSTLSVEGYGILKRTQADIDAEGKLPPLSLVSEAENLPESFSWRSVPGVGSLLTPGGNQHIPKYCGACYAFGSLHTLQDRVKVARYLMNFDSNMKTHKHEAPDYIAAIQVLLNCNDKACSGGSVAGAWEFVRDFQGGGIPVEGCMRYEATDTLNCDDINICRNCMGSETYTVENPNFECFAIPSDKILTRQCFGDDQCVSKPYPRLGVESFGKLPFKDDKSIQREIASRGPVACALDATHGMLQADGKSILEDDIELSYEKSLSHSHLGVNSKNKTDHIVEVVGWGVDEETQIPYWEIRNSWGEYWADGGFAKVRRGRNDLLIESDCMWVIPNGWGSPGHGWEDYNSKKVNKAAKKLMLSSLVMNHKFKDSNEKFQEDVIDEEAGVLSENRLWLTLFLLSGLIVLSISSLCFYHSKSRNAGANARMQSTTDGYPKAAMIEMNAPLNRLRPFSQTQSYTSI